VMASTSEPRLRDEQFTFGARYVYLVRAVSGPPDQAVASADSTPLYLTPRNTFPPAAPAGLVAATVPATGQQSAYVELSWEASAEPDLAGYWIYRSEDPAAPGRRLNAQLSLIPTFRDDTVAAGQRYFYRVSAVDQAGNESPLGAAAVAAIPQQ
jgi:hypothetical protein